MEYREPEEQIDSIKKMINKERKKISKENIKKEGTKKEIDPNKPKRKYTRKIKEKLPSPKVTTPDKKSKSPKVKTPEIKMAMFEPPYNKIMVEVLEKLEKLMRKNRDPIHQMVYKRALETIRSTTEDIITVEQLKGKRYIGPIILSKFKEYIETGTLNLFEREKEKPGYELSGLYDQLSQIYGIGPKKAQELIDKGINSLDDLRERQDEFLNTSQKAGLKYYNDILKRIPRAEIDEYNTIFKRVFEKVSSGSQDSKYEIVGSYRRGLQESGDIDVILTSSDKSIFKKFTDSLLEENIILVTLTSGISKCLVITKLSPQSIARRVDFLYSSPEEYPFAILYFTGSKEFNTVMRAHALKLGVSLNEHGLSKKEPGKKKEEMISQKFRKEDDIFEYLNLVFKQPTERINGLAVQIKEKDEKVHDIKDESSMDFSNWKRGNYSENCNDVCEKAEMSCDYKEMSKLDNEGKIYELALKTGTDCLKYLSAESTPFLEDTGGKGCWYVKPGTKSTRKWCSKKSEKWNTNLCACTKKKKSKDEKKTKSDEQAKENPIKKYNLKIREEAPSIIPIISNQQPIQLKPPEVKTEEKKRRTYKKREPKEKKQDEKTKDENNIETKRETPIQIMPKNKELIKNQIEDFKKNGISVLEHLSEKELSEIVIFSSDRYYNSTIPIMTDNEYDIVKEYLERKYPKNPILQQIGAPITKNKVKLPFNMPSMDKIKPDSGALANWEKKYTGPYVLSCKLDGVSGMYVSNKDIDKAKLYTRGDGNVGQDISHLLKTLGLPLIDDIVVRGEFIMPKAVFNEKYKNTFANPRNLVSGIINSKTVDEKAKDLHFVAYEVIQPLMKPSEQMESLKTAGFKVVQNKVENSVTNESLSEVLKDWRTTHQYEIDGVIVCDDHIHSRKDGNPDYAFAFKMVMSDQMAEAKVVDVIWEASKSGYLKPRVRIEPIRVAGVTIEYATGFNAKFIEENKIGIGAVIQIIRSGDVIPHIKSVTEQAEKPKMPNAEYHWTDKHVDIVLNNVSEDVTVREKNITAFFTTLEVDGLSAGNVKRIMKAGFDTVPKILNMSKADFEKVDGFKEKMVNKLYDGIQTKVKEASLLQIMVASNMLGRGLGERKIRPILEAQPDILTTSDTDEEKIAKLRVIPGIGPENAKSFVSNIGTFLGYLKECGLTDKLEKSTVESEKKNEIANIDTTNPLYGKRIVMTKTRDATVIEKIKKAGGILEDGIGKNTFLLIVKTKDDISNKTKYANEHNIPIMTPEEFNQNY
jgi:NAD-dependent DNA ligase/DNA polymerase/3'-5' exonuclease PolX